MYTWKIYIIFFGTPGTCERGTCGCPGLLLALSGDSIQPGGVICDHRLAYPNQPKLPNKLTASVEEVIPPPVLDDPGTAVQDDQKKDDATAINTCGTDSVPVCPPSEVVPVFAIAAFENCPDEFLRDEYLDSLKRFLASENHLAQNVTFAEYSPPSSRCFRQGVFTHTMQAVLHVNVDRLWESPASYIRKHLGCPNNEWSKQNGTVVKLSRIHQQNDPETISGGFPHK